MSEKLIKYGIFLLVFFLSLISVEALTLTGLNSCDALGTTSVGLVFCAGGNSSSTTNWGNITGFPSACTAGSAITQLGTTPTCSAFLTTHDGNYNATMDAKIDSEIALQAANNITQASAINALKWTFGITWFYNASSILFFNGTTLNRTIVELTSSNFTQERNNNATQATLIANEISLQAANNITQANLIQNEITLQANNNISNAAAETSIRNTQSSDNTTVANGKAGIGNCPNGQFVNGTNRTGVICNSAITTVTYDNVTGNQNMSGTRNITNVNKLEALTIIGNLSWSNLMNYPSDCPSGSYITTLGDSVTCTEIDANQHQHQNILFLDEKSKWTNASRDVNGVENISIKRDTVSLYVTHLSTASGDNMVSFTNNQTYLGFPDLRTTNVEVFLTNGRLQSVKSPNDGSGSFANCIRIVDSSNYTDTEGTARGYMHSNFPVMFSAQNITATNLTDCGFVSNKNNTFTNLTIKRTIGASYIEASLNGSAFVKIDASMLNQSQRWYLQFVTGGAVDGGETGSNNLTVTVHPINRIGIFTELFLNAFPVLNTKDNDSIWNAINSLFTNDTVLLGKIEAVNTTLNSDISAVNSSSTPTIVSVMGTGSGTPYTTTSATYLDVINYTVTVPIDSKAIITVYFQGYSSGGSHSEAVAITNGTTIITENVQTWNIVTGGALPMTLGTIWNGTGTSQTFRFRFHNNGAGTTGIINNRNSTPVMTFFITRSN